MLEEFISQEVRLRWKNGTVFSESGEVYQDMPIIQYLTQIQSVLWEFLMEDSGGGRNLTEFLKINTKG